MVLRSAMMESLFLDTVLRQPCWCRYNWTNSTTASLAGVVTVGENGEVIRHDSDIFSLQTSRINHTSLFRLEPRCHRSGWSDLSRTADDCGAFVEGQQTGESRITGSDAVTGSELLS